MSSILVQVIVGGLLLGAVYALFSSGLTLIWGMMNIVNFAHGDFVMLGMYVAFVVWTLFGVGPFARRAGRSAGAGDARHHRLFRADPQRDERADAGADPRHLRPRAVAALFGVLGFRRQLHDAAGKYRRRHVRCARHPHPGLAPAGRRGRAAGDARPASAADAHLAGLEDAGGRRGFHRRATDGHPPRHHAGDRLGDCRRAPPASPAR